MIIYVEEVETDENTINCHQLIGDNMQHIEGAIQVVIVIGECKGRIFSVVFLLRKWIFTIADRHIFRVFLTQRMFDAHTHLEGDDAIVVLLRNGSIFTRFCSLFLKDWYQRKKNWTTINTQNKTNKL